MKALPRVTIGGKEYFLDERLMELRSVDEPWMRIPLKDYHVKYFQLTGKIALD